MDEYRQSNRKMWDELTEINARSKFYDLDGFQSRQIVLNPLELEELGPYVAGKRLLHLQCHFGMDTLSWARLGAEVTGVDFSPHAIELATAIADRVEHSSPLPVHRYLRIAQTAGRDL